MRPADAPTTYRNPIPTVDVLIEVVGGIVLIARRNPPLGWALPGGFVDEGESLERAAIREALEETGLEIRLVSLLSVYSDPRRDSRRHTVSTVFVASASGQLRAGDDAGDIQILGLEDPIPSLAFDHRWILEDYRRFKRTGMLPTPADHLRRLEEQLA